MHPIQLIVGLGNPGSKYTNTRHNAGAWFIENLAQAERCSLNPEKKFHSKHTKTILFGQECHLLLPTTYMNESGLVVRAAMDYFKIPAESILIAHDDIDLPPGIVRLKFDGGAGGHNGLKDIIDHLHTKKFYRLRIGVGHPGMSKDVVNYVLNAPSINERSLIDEAIQRAQSVLPAIMAGDVAKAMQQLHTKEKSWD